MYSNRWQLERSPFAVAPSVTEAYPAPPLTEAIARIEYLVDQRRRVGVLLGAQGLGKSTTLSVARCRLVRRGVQVAQVDALGNSPRELLWQICAQLGAAPRGEEDVPRLWRRLEDRLSENRWQKVATVLLVDDAGQAGHDSLQQLARLARLETHGPGKWTIVLAAESSQLERWPDTLLFAVDLRIDLDAWSENDTIDYVQNALVHAGGIAPVFTDEALVKLHDLTQGNPRFIARLADFSLLAGAGAGVEQVDSDAVMAAFDEIRWSPAELAAV